MIQKIRLQKMLILLGVIVLSALFLRTVSFYSNSMEKIADSPQVYNLTNKIMSAKIKFGLSPDCGDIPCWAKDGADDSKWDSVLLKSYNYKTHPDFNSEEGGVVFYRIRIIIPNTLKDLNETISFTPITSIFNHIEMFHNDKLIESRSRGSKTNYLSSISLYDLSPESIKKGHATFTLKASYDPGSTGLLSRSKALLGPKAKLIEVYSNLERSMNSYYIVFFAGKAALFIFFAMIFLFTNARAYTNHFLIYAFAITVEPLLVGDLFSSIFPLNIRVLLYFTLNITAYVFLGLSLLDIANKNLNKISKTVFAGVSYLTVVILCYDFGWGTRQFTIDNLYLFSHIVLTAILVYTLVVVSKTLQFKNLLKSKNCGLFIAIGSYAGIAVWQLAFEKFRGYNYRHIFDLMFFLFIAYTVIRKFADDQLTVSKQRQQLKEQAQDVALGRATSALAHDLRKPFVQLRMLIKNSAGNKSSIISENTKYLEESIGYAENLVSEILNIQRKAPLKTAPESLKDILDQACTLVRKDLNKHHITISTDIKSKHKVLASRDHLVSAIVNILTNAIEAITEMGDFNSGEIWIRSFDEDKKLKVIIGNSGPDIPEDKLLSIFEPLVTSGKNSGTGLGLSSVKNTLHLQSASVGAHNIGEGKGVEFELTLQSSDELDTIIQPKIDPQLDFTIDDKTTATIDKTKIKPLDDKTHLKIALIDDDELVHTTWSMLWDKKNMESFTSPQDFIAKVGQNTEKYDVIIMDGNFGRASNMNGFQLAEILTQKGFKNLVLCSGSESFENAKDLSLFASVLEKNAYSKDELIEELSSDE